MGHFGQCFFQFRVVVDNFEEVVAIDIDQCRRGGLAKLGVCPNGLVAIFIEYIIIPAGLVLGSDSFG